MIRREEIDHAIDASYDALALINTVAKALDLVELSLTSPHNGTISDAAKVLRLSYKKLEISHDALEHVVMDGFISEGANSHV